MSTPARQPRFSAVVPIYNVERYIDAFLGSLPRAGAVSDSVELIFIDDGSTDASSRIVKDWVQRNAPSSVVLRTENRGVSAARNLGLARARGEWVTFPDSDDVLGPGYFEHLTAALDANIARAPVMLSANIHRIFDPSPVWKDVHALRGRFVPGTRIVDIDDDPDVFQMAVGSAVFPTESLRASGAAFMSSLHASEDALFVAEYLLSVPTRRVALVSEAVYLYRRRDTGDSAIDGYRSDPRSYIDRFLDGYLPLLRRADGAGGVPGWLQSILLYECQWLFPQQLDPVSFATVLDADQRQLAREALGRCLAYVSDERLLRYDATALPTEVRALILALTGREVWPWLRALAEFPSIDGRIRIHSYGTWPATPRVEALNAEGRVISAEVGSLCPDYFEQRALREVIILAPHFVRAIRIDGVRYEVLRTGAAESIAQRADRRRRAEVGTGRWVVAPAAGAVRVRRYLPRRMFVDTKRWARESAAFVLAEARLVLRRIAALAVSASPDPRGWAVPVVGTEAERETRIALREAIVAGGLRLTRGSRALDRFRARYWVLPTAGRVPRIRGFRVAIHRGSLTRAELAGVNALGADVVLVDSPQTRAMMLERSRYLPSEIVYLGDDDFIAQVPSAVQEWERGRRERDSIAGESLT